MGLFKWRGPDKAAPGHSESRPPTEAEAESPPEPQDADQPESDLTPPSSGEAVPQEGEGTIKPQPGFDDGASPPLRRSSAPMGPGPDYSSEDQLLALVNELVATPSKNRVDRSTPAADDYPNHDEDGPSDGDGGLVEELLPAPTDQELETLRRLLLGREIEGLEYLHRHLGSQGSQARALSRVISEAIRLKIRHDDELVSVLKTTVDQIVRASVRSDPTSLADNLFPVMGPAIRRSIRESIRGMLQDFSRTLEKSFSLTGLKWRLESLRTGTPFSEVVLLKTLEYQVEQVFLIHEGTGARLLWLAHEEARAEAKDSDQVAAMFTAIQHFVNDSFARGELSTLDFGDRTIYVVRSPEVYLACVVRGQAPPSLRLDMQTALELIVMDCAEELDRFDGDTTPFKKALPHLEHLLTVRFKDADQKLPWRAKLLPVFLIAVFLGPPAYLGYEYLEMKKLEALIYQQATGPGLVPLRITPSLFGLWEITCLKDELAAKPEAALILAGLPRDRFQITYLPYVSEEGEIVAKRAEATLSNKPKTVAAEFNDDDNTLTLKGEAPLGWVLSAYERLSTVPGIKGVQVRDFLDPENQVEAEIGPDNILRLQGNASIAWRELIREKALATPGIAGVDDSGVFDDDDTLMLKALIAEVNKVVIHFPVNKDQPVPEDLPRLTQAIDDLVILEKLAEKMNLAVTLTIYGHADATGSLKHNYELSQNRTKALAAMLYSRGSGIPISTYGLGSDFAQTAEPGDSDRSASDQASRKIELRVHINRKGAFLAVE